MTSGSTKGRGGVVGVVLAAGSSSRFGSPKQLLRFEGAPLLERVVANANASSLDRVVVVLGLAADEVRAQVELGRALAVDAGPTAESGRGGCSSSLQAGLPVAADADALLLLLGDQPGVRAPVIDIALDRWRRERPWAAVTSYRGVLGHPFVFSRAAFEDLRGLHGDKAIWKLIERNPERVARIEIDLELPPDVDTPDDFERAVAHWRGTENEDSC